MNLIEKISNGWFKQWYFYNDDSYSAPSLSRSSIQSESDLTTTSETIMAGS